MARIKILRKICKMDVIYWAPLKRDQYDQVIFDVPLDLKCRWEDTAEEFLDEEGKETVTTSVVMLLQDVATGGKLMLGLVKNLKNNDPPSAAKRIRRFEKFGNMKSTDFVRTAYL